MKKKTWIERRGDKVETKMKENGPAVKEQFNRLAEGYDGLRRRLIPEFDSFYGAGIDALSFHGKAPRVLDIGAGTGIYSDFLLKRYPGAELTLIDFAEDMLDEAKKKFAGRAGVRFIAADYNAYDFGSDIGSGKYDAGSGKYDIVLSALSIHHLGPEETASLYEKIYDVLGDAGEFLNADLVKAEDPETDAKNDAQWTVFVKSNFGNDSEVFERFQQSKKVDIPQSIESQVKWLKESGFYTADIVFGYLNFAVFLAKKKAL